MATVINGRIFGKVGNLVYSSRNGVSYVKQAPKPSTKKPSAKQQAQRQKFALAMHFLSPLREILKESSQKCKGVKSPSSHIISEAITGIYPDFKIDYSKVRLISGDLARPDAEMAYLKESRSLSFCWSDILSFNAFYDDELIALIYCPSSKQSWHPIYLKATRVAGYCAITLPVEFTGKDSFVWLAYGSRDRRLFSSSVYLGNVLIQSEDHEKQE